jgi:uncharacterized membrane protein
MRYRTIILWGLFIGIILLGTIYINQEITGSSNTCILNFSGLTMVGKLILGLATLLLFLHSVWTLGVFSGTSLIALSFTTGLIFEIVGVNYAEIFGGHYFYNIDGNPRILDVPLLIPLIWAGFIYAGYSIVSSFSVWLNRGGFGITQRGMRHKLQFATLSAFVVLAIDLIMEPLQVAVGNWRWLESGRYFNIPAGNFLGWFLVAFLSTFIFVILQDYLPVQREDIDKKVLLIPVIGYGLLCVIFIFWAIRIGMSSLVSVGFITMSPTVVVNLSLYVLWLTRIKRISENHTIKIVAQDPT